MGIAKWRVSLVLLSSTRLKLSFSNELLCYDPTTSVRNNEGQKEEFDQLCPSPHPTDPTKIED